MGLFDLFDDVKENAKKRRQAEEYRKDARRYVKDGEALYNKAYNDVTAYANETSYKINEYYYYKQRLIKEISQDVKPVLNQFSNFDIDRKVFDTPEVNSSALGSLSGEDLVGSLGSMFAPTIDGAGILGLFSGDASEEYWEARRQKDEAKRFYENTKYEREKLRNSKEKMRQIRDFIWDEKELLNSLTSKVKQIANQLKSSMNKASFSSLEADYLKGIHRIAENLNKLLTTKFLNDNFTISNQYNTVYENIKNINNALQEAPVISSDSARLRKILQLIATSGKI